MATSQTTSQATQSLPGGIPKMPSMMYGTAWKTDRTADLVYEAIKAGFRGIDTAAMAKHYNEAGTGEGIRRAVDEGLVKREDLFIQTKFSPGDPAYASHAQIPDQVTASVETSLQRLRTDDGEAAYLDCVVLHSPFSRHDDTLAAWAALGSFVPQRVRAIGISNAPVSIVRDLLRPEMEPRLRPAVVQNRFCARERGWDVAMREVCRENDIKYQGFWTLTANPGEWQRAQYVGNVSEGANVERAVAWYALMLADDIVVLNGTTATKHMREDLEGLARLKEWKGTENGGQRFQESLEMFRRQTGGSK
jgi:diketogulonate reductase-like aldo/keto reductase